MIIPFDHLKEVKGNDPSEGVRYVLNLHLTLFI